MSVRCEGKTVAGKRCSKRVANGTHCHLHVSQAVEVHRREPPRVRERIPQPRRLREVKVKTPEKLPTPVPEKKSKKEKSKKEKEKPTKWVEEKPNECPVCYDVWCDDDTHLPCGHWVHHKCVLLTGKKQCPMCRQNVDIPGEVKPKTPPRYPDILSLLTGGTEELRAQQFMYHFLQRINQTQVIAPMPVITLRHTPVAGTRRRRVRS